MTSQELKVLLEKRAKEEAKSYARAAVGNFDEEPDFSAVDIKAAYFLAHSSLHELIISRRIAPPIPW